MGGLHFHQKSLKLNLIYFQKTFQKKREIEKWYKLNENDLWKLDDGAITTFYIRQSRGEEYKDLIDW